MNMVSTNLACLDATLVSTDRLRTRIVRTTLVTVVLLGCSSLRAADDFKISPTQMQAMGIQVQRLDKLTPVGGFAYPARVVLPPSQEIVLSAPLSGTIDQLLVMENEAVKVGQPLLRLASPEFGELQVRLVEAASKSRLSQKALMREKALFAEGIVAERRVQEVEAAAVEDRARQMQVEGALRMAGVDAATIRSVAEGGALKDVLVLRARAPGVVMKLDAKPGQRVQSADALVRIADVRHLWLDVQIPVDRQSQVALKGAPLTGVGRKLAARALSFGPVVSDSQTVMLRAAVTQGAAELRLGEALQVSVPFATSEGWNVPQVAVVRHDDKTYVFVRTPEGFVATPVTVQAGTGQSLLVTGALKSGQDIAVSSVIALKAAWLGKGGSE